MTPRRFELRTPDDDSDRRMLADVAEHGWHGIYIPEDDEGPGFGFTVGLYYSYGHPELFVQGLDVETAHGIFWSAVRELERTGEALRDGDETHALLEGYPARLRAMPRSAYRPNLGTAMWFYKPIAPEQFPALQVLWPDKAGKFPGDPACDPRCAALQELALE